MAAEGALQMNIAEIAEMAGVSRAAVSRYFNNGYISREKREAIREVVEKTGYRPSAQAQTLRTKKTKMIGIIVPKLASLSIGLIVDGALSVLNESGYQALLAVTRDNPKKELEYLSAFRDKQVDGVILVATILGSGSVHTHADGYRGKCGRPGQRHHNPRAVSGGDRLPGCAQNNVEGNPGCPAVRGNAGRGEFREADAAGQGGNTGGFYRMPDVGGGSSDGHAGRLPSAYRGQEGGL